MNLKKLKDFLNKHFRNITKKYFFVADVLSDIKRISKATTEIQISIVIEIQIGTRLHTVPFFSEIMYDDI